MLSHHSPKARSKKNPLFCPPPQPPRRDRVSSGETRQSVFLLREDLVERGGEYVFLSLFEISKESPLHKLGFREEEFPLVYY